jgi:deoxyhypusine synthase
MAPARPTDATPAEAGAVRAFLDKHFLHFNSRELVAAACAYRQHIDAGGKMIVALAGAMSTARIGQILARMIRDDLVHAITCTGANLEEDLFVLLAGHEYELCSQWRSLTAEDEKQLYDRGMNRVTDTCIPETVMRQLEQRLVEHWRTACRTNRRLTPGQFLFEIIREGELDQHFQLPAEDSWVLAAAGKGIPIYTPGWEDSSTGNFLTAAVMRGEVAHHQCVKTGTEQMQELVDWYLTNCNQGSGKPSVGFFQIGGGIAGDFAICAVPLIMQDLKKLDTPFWGYFCQISDAITSYGGYSGAVPNEKITWGKLDTTTPKFMIQSDASIVAPLIFAHILND